MGLSQHLDLARAAGCPRDQMINFRRTGCVPTPKQLLFHAACRAADEPGAPVEIGFGGARGGGKSHAVLAQLGLDDCQRLPGCKALLLRRIGRAARESFEDLRRSVLRIPHTYRRSEGIVDFPNGSKIVLGHFLNESDVDRYLGLSYDVIAAEECTGLSLAKYKILRTCGRTDKPGWRPRTYNSSNPGGIGHSWYKRRFVSEQSNCAFIPALVTDNPFINEGYIHALNDLTGWLKRAWRYGDWDIAIGQYYSTWRPDVHVVSPMRLLHDEWSFSMAIDYGFAHPTTALVLAQDNRGDVHVVAEYGASKRLPETHSKSMLSMLHTLGLSRDWLQSVVIGSDAFRTDRDGKCVADDYARLGWGLDRATMSRVPGATEILRRLGEPPEIRPTLYIWDTCPRLIEQLPAMQHDPKQVEDVLKVDVDEDGYGGDDYYDTLRYGLMELAVDPPEYGPGLVWQRRTG